MARRLPDDPDKRRLQTMKRLYQHLSHFRSLMEAGRMDFNGIVTLDTGEDVYLPDLMVGIDSLPRRQRQAFELICLQGYTETAARDVIMPSSSSSTPVQQYADSALVRMVAKYDEKQAALAALPHGINWRLIMAALHPVLRGHVENARKDIINQIEGLKMALSQADQILGLKPSPSRPLASPKPNLNELARELVQTGVPT